MKRFLMLVGVAVVAAAMYVTAGSASQRSAGPTAKQFAALKKQVASMSKELKTVKAEAADADGFVRGCLLSVNSGVLPINDFGDPPGPSATSISTEASSSIRRVSMSICRRPSTGSISRVWTPPVSPQPRGIIWRGRAPVTSPFHSAPRALTEADFGRAVVTGRPPSPVQAATSARWRR
jgi:hypothetical protein